MADTVSHDQNFKNLIVYYPRDALAFFAPEEAPGPDDDVRIIPARQEQLTDRLGDRYRALDAPLLVQWADGRRDAVVFALEEESDWRRFSPRRLARYCLDIADMYDTNRVVPVTIFLRAAERAPTSLVLGTERCPYLVFKYVACKLAEMHAERWLDSSNLVARLNLPNMQNPAHDPLDVYHGASNGQVGKTTSTHDFSFRYRDDSTSVLRGTQDALLFFQSSSGVTTRLVRQEREQWRLRLDESNRVTSISLGDETYSITYKSRGKISRVLRTSPFAQTTQMFEYDDAGRLRKAWSPQRSDWETNITYETNRATVRGGSAGLLVFRQGPNQRIISVASEHNAFTAKHDDGRNVISIRSGESSSIPGSSSATYSTV